jgi:hypothetical protein
MPTTNVIGFTSARLDPVINPDDAMASIVHVALAASQTLAAGTVLGQVTEGGRYKAYASSNEDGSQAPKVILQYPATTDSSGVVTNASEWGATNGNLTVPAYTQGTFRTEELTGLDSNAIDKLGGHLVSGDTSTGIFAF